MTATRLPVRLIGPGATILDPATVVLVDQKFAHVKWDDTSKFMAGRSGGGPNGIGVPLNCVEKIEEGA